MQTVRDQIREALRRRPHSALQISQAVGIAQADVVGHVEHLRRSLAHGSEVLRVVPARCAACEFVFEDRDKLTRPGKCPQCRATRVQPPMFSIEAAGMSHPR